MSAATAARRLAYGRRAGPVRSGPALLLASLALVLFPSRAEAIQFGTGEELTWSSIVDDSAHFLRNLIGEGDAAGARQAAVSGAILAGIACGLLGAFVTLRRMALVGDMLGHAVLPGIAIGFVLAGTKSPPALLLGAFVAGLVATAATRLIRTRSVLREDAAFGIVLSAFYALGIWLLSWILRSPRLSAEASGLKTYLFGNPAVILPVDLLFLASCAVASGLVVAALYKELLVTSFDPSFARSIGVPTRAMDRVLLALLTLVVVVSLNILGVVLVVAMLTIPPATAYLLTDRFPRMLLASAGIGAGASFLGVWASAALHVGVGPAIVCVAFVALMVVFLASPRHGLLGRWVRHRRLARRTERENLLASIFRVQEEHGDHSRPVRLEELAQARGETVAETSAKARSLRLSAQGSVIGDSIELTPAGAERARQIVRSHRLWELFLEREASLAPDHVHLPAEEVEHFLGDREIAELERLLEFPVQDPHGRAIPASEPPSSSGEEAGRG